MINAWDDSSANYPNPGPARCVEILKYHRVPYKCLQFLHAELEIF